MPTPTFPILPSGALLDSERFEMELEDPSMKSEMEGGYVISRARHTRAPRRNWKCAYTDISREDKLTIENFWIQVRGSSVIFNWPNPEDGQTYPVRFGDDKIRFEYVGIGPRRRWNVRFSLDQA